MQKLRSVWRNFRSWEVQKAVVDEQMEQEYGYSPCRLRKILLVILYLKTLTFISKNYEQMNNMNLNNWFGDFRRSAGPKVSGLKSRVMKRRKWCFFFGGSRNRLQEIAWRLGLMNYHLPGDSRWPFHPLVGGHQQPLKGSLNHPKKVTKTCQVHL